MSLSGEEECLFGNVPVLSMPAPVRLEVVRPHLVAHYPTPRPVLPMGMGADHRKTQRDKV
ncbi:hypothetical protein IFM47457_03668 [Aspergillus lentulus]|nr:hypothetical protein IFM47457_03668 [Aspergillus lentulus]